MKTFRYIFEYIIISGFFILFKFIGYKKSSNIGAKIGKIFGPIFRSKDIVIKNLNYAGIQNANDQKKIVEEMWENYGRIFAEYPFLKKFKTNEFKNYILIEGQEYLADIKFNKEKAVFISGHFNNFELMAMEIEKAGISLGAIYRPLNNPFLNIIMENIRKKYICGNQIKKGKSGMRDLLNLFREKFSIALMIDQRVSEGESLELFNRQAKTTTIPGQLAKKYGCRIVPVYIERVKKIYFKLHFYKPLKFDDKLSIEQISLELNKILEKMILKNPDQWIWSHDRWK